MNTFEIVLQWKAHTRKMLKLKPFSTKWRQIAEMRKAYENILMDRWQCTHHEMVMRLIDESHDLLQETSK